MPRRPPRSTPTATLFPYPSLFRSGMTFGYSRAEVIAALINLVTLIIVGLYLVYEAIARFFAPEPIAGWIVVIVAGIALAVDVVTAMLTYAMSKESINVKIGRAHV